MAKVLSSLHIDFIEYCRGLEDIRQPVKRSYPVDEILFLSLCATISGCEGWEEIIFFGEEHLDFLREYLPYENGIPSSVTIFRVISSIFPDGFERFFTSWFVKFFQQYPDSGPISIDGKTIRGSKKGGKDALHILHACDSGNGLLLGYKKVDGKTNEIPVAPELIKELDITERTITLDAMGCQRSTCETIVDNCGQYIIGLKGNQGSLHDDVKLLFEEKQYLDIKTNISVEKGHGRLEQRTIYATEDVGYLIEQHKWPHLKSVIMCENKRLDKDKSKTETLYYISSHEANALILQESIRKHWKVESMHWILDVTFNEDKIPIAIDNAAENLAFMRRMALNMLKIYQKNLTKNISIKRLRKTCLVRPKLIGEIFAANKA